VSRRSAWIFDMDGTLHDVRAARHHVTGPGPKRFDLFHQDATGLPPNGWVVDLARNASADGHAVLVVTARREMWRRPTAMWLALHDVPSDELYMRHDHDHRRDVEVKRDILARIRQRFVVVGAVDDNPSVIELWESEGIPTTVVPGWDDHLVRR